MTLHIIRDAQGNVTIVDPSTGRSEAVAMGVAGAPARRVVADAQPLPAHHWGKLA